MCIALTCNVIGCVVNKSGHDQTFVARITNSPPPELLILRLDETLPDHNVSSCNVTATLLVLVALISAYCFSYKMKTLHPMCMHD